MATRQDRMMKYLAISAAFMGLAMRVYSWITSATDERSEEGEHISPAEIAQLQGVATDALNQGFMSANIPIAAQVTLTPLE